MKLYTLTCTKTGRWWSCQSHDEAISKAQSLGLKDWVIE
jgi:hypothetical protein